MNFNRIFFYDKKHKKLRKGLLRRYNGQTYDDVSFYTFTYWYVFMRLMTGRYIEGVTN